jgi:hypothetical protein
MVDIAVVALGGLVEMGICTRAAMEEVMAANSRKRPGTNFKRSGSGGYDAVKPDGWKGPDWRDLVSVRRQDVDAISHVRRSFGEDYVIHSRGEDYAVAMTRDDFLRGFWPETKSSVDSLEESVLSRSHSYAPALESAIQTASLTSRLNDWSMELCDSDPGFFYPKGAPVVYCDPVRLTAAEGGDFPTGRTYELHAVTPGLPLNWSQVQDQVPGVDRQVSLFIDATRSPAEAHRLLKKGLERFQTDSPLEAERTGKELVLQADDNGFLKFDQGKDCRPELIPAPVIEALGKLYAYGATKYADENWRKGTNYQRYVGAIGRHMIDWQKGNDFDPPVGEGGNGTHNLVCVAWNALTLYMMQQLEVGTDDRPDLPRK